MVERAGENGRPPDGDGVEAGHPGDRGAPAGEDVGGVVGGENDPRGSYAGDQQATDDEDRQPWPAPAGKCHSGGKNRHGAHRVSARVGKAGRGAERLCKLRPGFTKECFERRREDTGAGHGEGKEEGVCEPSPQE
jgi:hypothetical protein